MLLRVGGGGGPLAPHVAPKFLYANGDRVYVHGASVKTGTITGTQLSNDVWPVVVHVGSRPTLQCFAESNMTPCFEPHERVLYVDAGGSLSEAAIVRVDTSMWPLSYEIRLPGGFERTTVPYSTVLVVLPPELLLMMISKLASGMHCPLSWRRKLCSLAIS